jgi:endo-1,4-beta-xylanase
MIDVVNEPLAGHNPPDGLNGRANYKDAIGGNGTTGWDWVIWAFQKARQYMPKTTKLILNDYGIINDNNATSSYLTLINLLKDRGLIDAIGVQGHRFEFESADTNTLKNNLTRLGTTGLPVYISEFDLGNLNNSGTIDDNQQLQLYKKIFPVIWKHQAVKGITLWGYIDGEMWQSTCGLIRSDRTSRPAFIWLADYVKNNPTDIKNNSESLPSNYELSQNYPNPFNPTTTIKYSIVKESNVKLKIYDMLGRLVQTLVDGPQASGNYSIEFNAGKLSSGIYFYALTTGEFSQTKKMLLMK